MSQNPAEPPAPPAVDISSEAVAARVALLRDDPHLNSSDSTTDMIEALAADRDRLVKTDALAQMVISEGADKDAAIARLSAQVEAAREALAETADFISDHVSDMEVGQRPHEREYLALAIKYRDKARAALAKLTEGM